MSSRKGFKALCAAACEGAAQRVLFISPNSPAREVQQLEFINDAATWGVPIEVRRTPREIQIGDSVALLRIAHPYLDREMKGMEFHFIHGLEHLEAFEDGKRIEQELLARVRL